MEAKIKAPFPAFGGKSRVASLVWSRFGSVRNYVEPFCFSAAMLLMRPDEPQIETINDLNAYVANFWRAIHRDPEAVAHHADWPVNETDLHARHSWLVRSHEAAERLQAVRDDPEAFDAKIAGWWCWGACMWIGSGWCEQQLPHISNAGQGVNTLTQQLPHMDESRGIISRQHAHAEVRPLSEKRPHIGSSHEQNHQGTGVHGKVPENLPNLSGDAGATGRGVASNQAHKIWEGRGTALQNPRHINKLEADQYDPIDQKRPCFPDKLEVGRGVQGFTANERPQLADAYSRGRGVHGNDSLSDCERRRLWLVDWFTRLSDRLRPVRVCCGHWSRVCDSDSTLTRLGTTGVFLDPPYRKKVNGKTNRASHIYANDKTQDVDALCDEVQAWCLKWGSDKNIRIAVCGLEGEYPDLDDAGWDKVEWKAQGGYGNRNKENVNAARERIWFSSACVENRQAELF